jgi:hypothetical protein
VERKKLNPQKLLAASELLMGEPSTIPEAGRESPGSGPPKKRSEPAQSSQTDSDERLMSLGMALAQALQHLAEKPER